MSRPWVVLAVALVALRCSGAPAGPAPGTRAGQPAEPIEVAAPAPAAASPEPTRAVGQAPLTAPPAPAALAAPAPAAGAGSELVVRGVVVRDLDGRVAWRGDVDLGPVLARIARGEKDPHRDDGAVFGNRERLLPSRPRGHYREYVVRTPGLRSVGPQRLVLGRDGEAYYTADHYRTFTQVRRTHGR